MNGHRNASDEGLGEQQKMKGHRNRHIPGQYQDTAVSKDGEAVKGFRNVYGPRRLAGLIRRAKGGALVPKEPVHP
jgi:hypothetical protein